MGEADNVCNFTDAINNDKLRRKTNRLSQLCSSVKPVERPMLGTCLSKHLQSVENNKSSIIFKANESL